MKAVRTGGTRAERALQAAAKVPGACAAATGPPAGWRCKDEPWAGRRSVATGSFEEGPLARKPNYGFQKRQKEMQRQARKDAKAERKREKKEAEEREQGAPQGSPEGGATPGEAVDV